MVIGVLWYLISRGLHSKCLIAGNSVTLEIRKQTAEEKNPRTVTEVVVLPEPVPTVIEVPAQTHVSKHHKKAIRVSAPSETLHTV